MSVVELDFELRLEDRDMMATSPALEYDAVLCFCEGNWACAIGHGKEYWLSMSMRSLAAFMKWAESAFDCEMSQDLKTLNTWMILWPREDGWILGTKSLLSVESTSSYGCSHLMYESIVTSCAVTMHKWHVPIVSQLIPEVTIEVVIVVYTCEQSGDLPLYIVLHSSIENVSAILRRGAYAAYSSNVRIILIVCK